MRRPTGRGPTGRRRLGSQPAARRTGNRGNRGNGSTHPFCRMSFARYTMASRLGCSDRLNTSSHSCLAVRQGRAACNAQASRQRQRRHRRAARHVRATAAAQRPASACAPLPRGAPRSGRRSTTCSSSQCSAGLKGRAGGGVARRGFGTQADKQQGKRRRRRKPLASLPTCWLVLRFSSFSRNLSSGSMVMAACWPAARPWRCGRPCTGGGGGM